MTIDPVPDASSIADIAREALARGYQPVPIRRGTKAPRGTGWTHRRISPEAVEAEFSEVESLGLLLGEVSAGLVDVDLDHPTPWRLRDMFLPDTSMRTGRAGNPNSHYWYRTTGSRPGYRKYTLPAKPDGTPGGETLVELRTSAINAEGQVIGHQTLIPPSVWYPKPGENAQPQSYRWEGEAWGGSKGPERVDGKHLAVRVASLALVSTLVEGWPQQGSRHDAYLALAGGMLRLGRESVHPYWSKVLPQIIEALAEATHDRDGGRARVAEVIPTTETKIRSGAKVQGWPTLAEILGEGYIDRSTRIVREIEDLVNWQTHLSLPSTNAPLIRPDDHGGEQQLDLRDGDGVPLGEEVGPLEARAESWDTINLEPYLAGEVVVPDPTILRRTDGLGIFYPGRVNSLYGRSESAKSWIAMYACMQEISAGERVVYVDLEDDPAMAIHRLRQMGAMDDDIRSQFTYIRPESPHLAMLRDSWGNPKKTPIAEHNALLFSEMLERVSPGLVIVDGMSVLYGLHNLSTNDVTSTDVITNWLKSITRNNRSTVIVIDHTTKGAEKGATPIGSQHKISMVQGSAIQVVVITQPKPTAKGHVELVIGKDRPGKVRQHGTDARHALAADVFIDSTVDGVTDMQVLPPDKDAIVLGDTEEGEKRLVEMGEKMRLRLAAVEMFQGRPNEVLKMGEIARFVSTPEEPVASDNKSLYNAMRMLVTEGMVEKIGEGNKTTYVFATPERRRA